MIKVRPLPSGEIAIESQKQKDDEGFAPLRLRLKSVVLDIDADSGRTTTSCVLVEGNGSSDDVDLHPGLVAALNALAALPGGKAHSSEWYKALPQVNGKLVPDRTFHNWRQKLLEKKLVRAVPDCEHVYELTTAGAATAKPLPSPTDSSQETAATAITLEGGSEGRESEGEGPSSP